MPTYEYRCKGCGYEFEKFQAMSEEPVSECSKCGGTVERLLSGGSGIIMKGSHFSSKEMKHDTCCSHGESCDNPKRCCEN